MTKKTWVMSAVVVIIVGLFVGTAISNTVILDFLATPVQTETEQIAVSQSPWEKTADTLTTQLSYETPAGLETNSVTINIDTNNIITDFEMTIDTTNDVSIAYQKKFIPEVSELLIGKNINELTGIDTVAGASLTTQAFTDALKKLPI